MKTFRIGVFEEIGGYIEVKAKTRKQAEKEVLEYAENYGLSYCEYYGIKSKKVDITHRDVNIVD